MDVGLIGCGRVAELHMCAYKHIPEANAIAVSDINLDRAEAFSRVMLDQSTSHNQKITSVRAIQTKERSYAECKSG